MLVLREAPSKDPACMLLLCTTSEPRAAGHIKGTNRLKGRINHNDKMVFEVCAAGVGIGGQDFNSTRPRLQLFRVSSSLTFPASPLRRLFHSTVSGILQLSALLHNTTRADHEGEADGVVEGTYPKLPHAAKDQGDAGA